MSASATVERDRTTRRECTVLTEQDLMDLAMQGTACKDGKKRATHVANCWTCEAQLVYWQSKINRS